jgi:hypothetical protein
MDETMNTRQAHHVHSNDDYDDNACNDPTTFNHASNANDIMDTSVLPVIFLLLDIKDPGEDEDFIGPDGQANPLPERFSLAPRTTVHVSRHIDTAVTPPTTNDYTSIPVGMNMTHKEPCHLGPPPSWPRCHVWQQQPNQPLPSGLITWVPVYESFRECFSSNRHIINPSSDHDTAVVMQTAIEDH